jgi:DNA-binding ferritin-like protein (Dps family)
MKLKEMIRETNRLRAQLNEDNKAYYGEMLVYIRSSDIDQRKAEEMLLEILQHLLQAQKEGRSASVVFGNQPIEYCRELMEQIPKPPLSERSYDCVGFTDMDVSLASPERSYVSTERKTL